MENYFPFFHTKNLSFSAEENHFQLFERRSDPSLFQCEAPCSSFRPVQGILVDAGQQGHRHKHRSRSRFSGEKEDHSCQKDHHATNSDLHGDTHPLLVFGMVQNQRTKEFITIL